MRLMTIALLMVIASPALGGQNEVWTPKVEFKLESSNYTETLLWVSGFSYALTEMAKQSKESGTSSLYCLPSRGYISSKDLLEILNQQFSAKSISAEVASLALLRGVSERFPCK